MHTLLTCLYMFSCAVLLVHSVCKCNMMDRRSNHVLRFAYVCMAGGSSWQIFNAWHADLPPLGNVVLVGSCALAVLAWWLLDRGRP